MTNSARSWTPSSWKARKVTQDVIYPVDQHAPVASSSANGLATEGLPANERLHTVKAKLCALPPLVTAQEIERLRQQLADVANSKAFLLQAGHCAESFEMCTQEQVESQLSLILLMSLVLIWGARMPVVRIMRGAGQYAKPRSKPTEVHDGKEILTFRGDNVNGFDPDDRTPDPDRLLQAYFHSATTLNFVRAVLSSGFADLHHPRSWSMAHVRSPELARSFESVIERLEDSLDFIRVIGGDASDAPADTSKMSALNSVDMWTSHEGLLLHYEEALTRSLKIPRPSGKQQATMEAPPPIKSDGQPKTPSAESIEAQAHIEASGRAYYNVSAHFIWIGDRTRQLDGAHVEYFRGIRNPIGIKVGPSMQADELVRLLDIVDPDKEPGRVTLICRYGADKINMYLAEHIHAVRKSLHPVIFACDPMHGNTKTSESSGSLKTRHMADIVKELSASIRIHASLGSRLQGVHLELTGEVNSDGFSVTECVGGSMELSDADLSLNYQSFCDPRLNYEQSLGT
ncbi:uncharacterized protein L969DRAFT_425409 [Mixia osmundae IAM 14324]|uniref:uncharacterized protein n=1 Tax=Mixia osmundae (strain CBS 9802 / IAM 14324 / JCM 22182 / KY 12970) TaxID=764103 RepID=UPI0004A548F4|nr:uncharacterized protein L969DRAFT_425409 [Mixia osmundae IAM 14324]KEI40431.1 hypothetical protein L969DRAFT_425409 [Mixia osmundae IAM 14324]